MNALRRRWRWWVELLGRRERATVLALVRIGVALVIAATIITMIAAGLVDVLWVDRAFGGMRSVRSGYFVMEVVGGPAPGPVWAMVTFALVACGAMALGVGGRLTVIAALIGYRSLSTIGLANGGYDSMIFNLGWLLVLADSTATLSFDCWRKTGRWTSDRLVPAWPRYLAIFQLVVLYTVTGMLKLGAAWGPSEGYSALYWFLQDPTWIRFDMGWVASVFPLSQVMTFAVWHFEVLAPVLLLVFHYRATRDRPGRLRAWANRWDLRVPWAAFGIAMHLGIAVLLEMGPFSWVALVYYVCLWQPAEIEAAVARVAGLRSARARPA